MEIFEYTKNFGTHGRNASYLEVCCLSVVLLCLPLFEAPKNVASLCFLVAWLVQLVRTGSFGSGSPFDLPIFGLTAILWVSPLFSEYGDIVTPLNSAPRWTLLGLFVLLALRLNYSRPQIMLLLSALLLGGTVAVFESFWVWHLNGRPYPEFRSVGHVNHSSMYSIIPLAAGIGALYSREKLLLFLGALAIFASLTFLPPSKSLVGALAILAVLTIACLNLAFVRNWSISRVLASSLAIALIILAVLLTPPAEEFRSELVARVTGDNFFSGRDKILNSALAVWDQHPVVGTGWSSFGISTSEAAVRAALEADGVAYDPNLYWHYPHGHNLWTTMLIERGLVGFALVTILLFLFFKTFLPIAWSREELDTFERGAAVGALLVAVGFAVAGLGNTTMMNEHGHAGMAFIAVVYGYLRGQGFFPKNNLGSFN